MAGLRQYVCNIYKELRIGKYVKFDGGFYETEDRNLQELIEGNNLFGVSIHYKDEVAEMERVGRERQEKVSADKAKERKRILQEMADERETDKRERDAAKASLDEEKERDEELARLKDLAGEGEGGKTGKAKGGKK